MKRFGANPQRGIVYRRRPGVYAVLWDGVNVLLTHQSSPKPEFQLPGGGIDAGENPIPALHREVMEETGWHIGNIRRLGAYKRFAHMPEYNLHAEKLCTIYLARPVMRISNPTEAGHSAIWCNIKTALELIENKGDLEMMRLAFGQSAPR
jgi:8-oxo-dGTP diphosphatase